MKYLLMGLLGVLLLVQEVAAEEVAGQSVATVNGVSISVDDYLFVSRKAIRERFYHGAIPEAEM